MSLAESILDGANMLEPILYIMCGLPFSGKTTLAQALTRQLGFPIVGIDNIREERGFSWEDNAKVTAEDWKSIFNESFERTLAYLKDHKCVIYDSANQDRASRDRLRNLAQTGNFNSRVIFVNVPEDEIKRRWLKNQETNERFHLPEKYLQAAIDTFEKPADDENVVVYNPNIDLDTWIADTF